jgi:serine/threonine protein kinase
MSPHLCDEQIHRLLGATLADDELVSAEAHLWQCPDCRDALRRRTEPTPDVPPVAAPRSEGAAPGDALPAVPGYEVLGELGRGGMAVVYQARQLRPNRVVALKVLQTGLPADARRRFGAESETLARLQHPGIVQVYEAGEHDGRPFFSLEFCGGGSLARKLAAAPMEPRQAAALVEAVARAVAAAHRAGIVHRDLKPANILLQMMNDECGMRNEKAGAIQGSSFIIHHSSFIIPKVSDFGLAKLLTSDAAEQTRSGAILGTPSYVAPEQLNGAVGPAADVYSLGAILYECLTGRPPFRAATVLETLELVRSREPVPPRQLRPGVPADLETVCLKCLEKESGRRYATAEGLADDLRCFGEGRPVVARPVSRPERLRRWARRNPLPATLAAVLALAVTAGLASALALWWNAERHLREEEIARRESEDRYLTCRHILGEYVAVTRDPHLQSPAARRGQREALVKARAFCEGLALRRPDDPSLQRVLAEVCTGLASLDAHDGRLDEARQAGETARALWQQVAARAPDADCRDRLAHVLSTLGLVYGHLGRNAQAAASLRQALALWDQLGGEGAESTSAQLAASTARIELACRLFDLGAHREQVRMYEENCSRLERAVGAGGGPPELRLELLVSLSILGDWYQHDGKRVDSERCWRRGYELGRRLIDEMPDSGSAVFHLAFCRRQLAAKDPAAAPPEETARLCEQAARLLEAQRLRDPADRTCTQELANLRWMLADCYIQAGQHALALGAARRAAAVLTELADRRPGDPEARLQVFLGLSRLAEHEGRCGESSAARQTARQAADGLEGFCEARPIEPQSLSLAASLGAAIAQTLRHAASPDQGLRVVQCCLRTFERLIREYPDDPAYQAGLSEAWTQLGKANISARRREQAEAALRASVQVAGQLAERWPEYRPLHEDRLRRLERFLNDRSAATTARAAPGRAKQ